MTKKIAIINDLSGFGRCSLTAAISVTSIMGNHPCPLPTAILSAQTGFDSYYCYDCTPHMREFHNQWQALDAKFDGIYSGFVSCPEQLDEVLHFVETFKTEKNFLLVDPVLGDDGHPYKMYSENLLDKMHLLSKKADIITPNLTELCLLCDVPFESINATRESGAFLETIHHLGKEFLQSGPSEIIVTGIRYCDNEGIRRIGNSYISKDCICHHSTLDLGGSYSGTGDLFASCIANGKLQGRSIPEIMVIAANFIHASIEDSLRDSVPYIEGVNYEKNLILLMEQGKELTHEED